MNADVSFRRDADLSSLKGVQVAVCMFSDVRHAHRRDGIRRTEESVKAFQYPKRENQLPGKTGETKGTFETDGMPFKR